MHCNLPILTMLSLFSHQAETIKKKELPVQYLFQNEIEAYKSREAGGPRCGECIEQSEVVGFCTTCSLSMCEECQRGHQRLTKFMSHRIKNAKQVSEDQLLKVSASVS